MTGISDIPDKLNPVKQQGANKTKAADSNLFKKTFNEALDSVVSEKTDKPSTLPPLGEISSAQFDTHPTNETGLEEKTDQLLSKLETYNQHLANPDISLREIEPLITEIKDKASELSIEAQKNDTSDPSLKRVADESALSASLEYVKFMRGDYI